MLLLQVILQPLMMVGLVPVPVGYSPTLSPLVIAPRRVKQLPTRVHHQWPIGLPELLTVGAFPLSKRRYRRLPR